MNFPKHEAGLTLMHNEHKGNYDSVEEYLLKSKECGDCPEFETEESRQKCIDLNELWELRWYPDTPIGSYSVAAPTLDDLLIYANSFE